MKFLLRRIRLPLVPFLSLLLIFCPTYLQYNDLAEVDFLPSYPGFENFEVDNLIGDDDSRKKIPGSFFSPLISPSDFPSFGQTFHVSAENPSLVQPVLVLILRC